jgi:AraC-like DNA-binding protein
MPQTLGGIDVGGLERSGGRRSDSIRFGPSAQGVERAEVYLSTHAFDPHRHDTYAIGITTAGVQIFRYRGSRRICLPGQLHVLHPDESHDGAAGTDDGFGYRILYIAPELVRDALAGRALPFVADPVQEPTPAAGPIASLLADMRAVELVRDYLVAHASEQTPAAILEKIAGLDRFTIARQFRWAFGTSPDRYRTLRRLALARTAIESGQSLARAAAESGFADQSHMTRQFKRTYGLTPGRWIALTAASSHAHVRA